MAENTLDDGVTPGTSVEPTTAVQGGKTPADSGGGITQEALLQKIAELEGHVRTLQSEKDKGVQKALNKVSDFDEQLARYDKLLSKLDPDEAKFRLRMERFMAEQQDGGTSAPIPGKGGGGSPTQPASVDHTALLQSLGLDLNSADVLAVMRETDNYAAQVASFAAIAARRQAKPAPAPNPAQQVPTGGGIGQSERTIEDVEAELEAVKKKPGGFGSKRHKELVEEHRNLLPR